MPKISQPLLRKIAQLKAFLCDCDGVLTDGRLYYGEKGVALKAFDAKDGMGLVLLREAGVRVGIVSADRVGLLDRRAEKLGIGDVFQGVSSKVDMLVAFAEQYLLDPSEIGYMGDDVNDLDAINRAGVSFAPADAVEAVRKTVDWVTPALGGRGAVREVTEMILAARRSAS